MPEVIQNFLEVHVALAPVLFILFRTISIILAPFPGSFLDFISIALFGRIIGFIYAEISIMLGASIAFWIARRFREPVVEKFISLNKIHEWEERLEKRGGFWGLTFIRMITISIFDYLSYVAGLMKMSFGRFFITSLLGSIPPTALFYYAGGIFLEQKIYLAVGLGVTVLIITMLMREGKIFKTIASYLSVKNNIRRFNDAFNNGKDKREDS